MESRLLPWIGGSSILRVHKSPFHINPFKFLLQQVDSVLLANKYDKNGNPLKFVDNLKRQKNPNEEDLFVLP